MLLRDFGLHERLVQALDRLGLDQATPVQAEVIPPALEGRDIQASAETGSGKTAAFLLPVLHRLLERPAPDTATRCLVLLPTRELAAQIHKHFRDLARFTHLKAGLLLGGDDFKVQRAMVRKNPEVLIGTPGRVKEHVERGSVELGDLEALILDEADRMLDMGFRDDVMSVVRACRADRQTMLLSATLRHEGIGRIAAEVLREPVVVALGEFGEHAAITQRVVLADDNGHKRQLLTWLLAHERYEKALVFCNTRESVEEVAAFLRAHKRRTAALHGEMEQDERKRVMGLFRTGGAEVLVATDLAARGLDVAGVDLVINFALARSGDEYVHRVGRTGRAGRQGLAISLVSHQEWNRLCAIERYLGVKFERFAVEGLVARFKEPATGRTGGKKDAKKKGRNVPAKKAPAAAKPKQRLRDRKNIGKRRKPSAPKPAPDLGEGFAPLTRKKS